jgi:poly-gamma-glutamate biosynthesis protein PgsC/CapC
MSGMSETDVIVIGIGLVVSLLYTELFGVAPGGIIVPGYLALAIPEPLSVALTFGVALLTYFVVRVLGTIAIVYGRRRAVISILIGFLLGTLARTLLGAGASLGPFEIDVVGYVIPGLLAIWMDRQGVVVTLTSTATASIATRLAGLLWMTG